MKNEVKGATRLTIALLLSTNCLSPQTSKASPLSDMVNLMDFNQKSAPLFAKQRY